MELITNFFNVNNILFTFLNYQMSYLEFFGTLFTLWSVWLISRNNIWNWPVGIVGTVLFGVLFFQIQLYSDFFEQIYFLITAIYGWWLWIWFGKGHESRKELVISKSSKKTISITLISIAAGTLLMGYFISNIHIYFPSIFMEPASYPYLDAFTTVMSFAATVLLIYRKIESWYIWILVDIIGIGLYFKKEVVFISLLYVIFLILATNGLFTWRRLYKKHEQLRNGY